MLVFFIAHRKSGFYSRTFNHIIFLRTFPITFSTPPNQLWLLVRDCWSQDHVCCCFDQEEWPQPSYESYSPHLHDILQLCPWKNIFIFLPLLGDWLLGNTEGHMVGKKFRTSPPNPVLVQGPQADRHAYIIGDPLGNVCPTCTISKFMLTESFTISEKTCLFIKWCSL